MKQLWTQATVALATAIFGMIGFWLVEGRQLVARDDVLSMLATQSPYVVDRKLIFEALADRKNSQAALAEAIKANTSAVADLRVVIAELNAESRHLRQPAL